MHDQPTRATTAAPADMFDLIEADLLRILRRRARLGDLRLPEPGRPRPPQAARQPVAGRQSVGTPRLRVLLAGGRCPESAGDGIKRGTAGSGTSSPYKGRAGGKHS